MSLLLTLQAWKDSSAEQATPGKEKSQVPAALAALGLGWAGLSGAPRLAVPAGRATGCGRRRGPALPLPYTAAVAALCRPWRSRAGARTGREQPGRGGRGAGLGRARGGARAARALGGGGGGGGGSILSTSASLQASFSLPSFFPSFLRLLGLPGSSHGGAVARRVSCDRGCVHFPRPGKTPSRLTQPGPSFCASARVEPQPGE